MGVVVGAGLEVGDGVLGAAAPPQPESKLMHKIARTNKGV
jgi:hypothetical protein